MQHVDDVGEPPTATTRHPRTHTTLRSSYLKASKQCSKSKVITIKNNNTQNIISTQPKKPERESRPTCLSTTFTYKNSKAVNSFVKTAAATKTTPLSFIRRKNRCGHKSQQHQFSNDSSKKRLPSNGFASQATSTTVIQSKIKQQQHPKEQRKKNHNNRVNYSRHYNDRIQKHQLQHDDNETTCTSETALVSNRGSKNRSHHTTPPTEISFTSSSFTSTRSSRKHPKIENKDDNKCYIAIIRAQYSSSNSTNSHYMDSSSPTMQNKTPIVLDTKKRSPAVLKLTAKRRSKAPSHAFSTSVSVKSLRYSSSKATHHLHKEPARKETHCILPLLDLSTRKTIREPSTVSNKKTIISGKQRKVLSPVKALVPYTFDNMVKEHNRLRFASSPFKPINHILRKVISVNSSFLGFEAMSSIIQQQQLLEVPTIISLKNPNDSISLFESLSTTLIYYHSNMSNLQATRLQSTKHSYWQQHFLPLIHAIT